MHLISAKHYSEKEANEARSTRMFDVAFDCTSQLKLDLKHIPGLYLIGGVAARMKPQHLLEVMLKNRITRRRTIKFRRNKHRRSGFKIGIR